MKNAKRSLYTLWAIPGLLLVAAGCNGNNQGAVGTSANGGAAATTPVDGAVTTGVDDAPASVTEPNQPVRAYVRAVHTVPNAGPVALAVDGEPVINGLAFGNASEFVGLHGDKVKIHSTNDHQITVVDAEGKTLGGPLSVDLERGEDVTVVIGGTPDKITLTPFEHTNRGPDRERAKIAVLHADKALPEVAISVNNKIWRGDVGYGEVTGYQELAPGTHTMKVMYDKSLVGVVDVDRAGAASAPRPVPVRGTSVTTLTQPLNLSDGAVYSVILYADAAGTPKLRFLEDKFVPPLVRAPDADAATS